MKQIIITVLVVVGIVGGAMILSGGDDAAAGVPSNNFYGAEEGIITIREYGDFECPACAGFFPIVSQVKEQFKDTVRFEFKHFPLVQIHGNAQAAHRSAQAAANQGKFWEMHDLLYQNQQSWNTQATNSPTGLLESYARQLELDMDKYLADAAASETLTTINADIALGKDQGASATPTFFIDGELIEDTNSISTVESFAAVVQEAIDAKTGSTQESSGSAADTNVDATKPEEEN